MPEIKDGEPSEHTHYAYPKPEAIDKIEPAVKEKISSKKEIKVRERLHSAHSLVWETRSALKTDRPDKYDMLWHNQQGCFKVRVGRESIKRALRILDALIREFKSQGFLVSEKSEGKTQTQVKVDGERVPFSLIEDTRQVDHVLTEEEKRHKKAGSLWSVPRWEFVPTGKLSLIIEAYGATGVRRKWSDATRKPLEQKLGDFMRGVLLFARALREERVRREEEHRKWEEEQKRREEEERQRRAEEARLHDLEAQASQWAKSRQLRAYIRAVGKKLREKSILKTHRSELTIGYPGQRDMPID